MVDGPDVRWDGIAHRTIVEWVSQGPGASLTSAMEQRLTSSAEALADTSEIINTAIQKAGGDWQGGAADAASAAMRVLRSFDDRMHFTSNVCGVQAFGQSDSSGFVRANVPPVVNVGSPPDPTGLPVDVILATEDYDNKLAAAKQAEQRAREVMQQYTAATVERSQALAPLPPAPQVVLDFGSGSTKPTPSHGPRPSPTPGPIDPGSSTGTPVPEGGRGTTAPPPAPDSLPTASATASSATAPATVPTQNMANPSPQPNSVLHHASGSATAPPPLPGGSAGDSPRSPGSRGLNSPDHAPRSSHGDRGGQPAVGARPVGQPAGETARERGAPTPARGGIGASGLSTAGIGGVPATREEDRQRQARYALPTAEHFESDPHSPLCDPHRDGWHVAPSVIGDDDAGDKPQP